MRISAAHAVAFISDTTDPNGCGVKADERPLPSLIRSEPRWGRYTGMKALMLAVLEEGIRNYLGSNVRFQGEAAYWIASGSRRSPFAFCTVCETLGLEPTAVRIALKRLREQNVSAREAVGRSRPNVRRPAQRLGYNK